MTLKISHSQDPSSYLMLTTRWHLTIKMPQTKNIIIFMILIDSFVQSEIKD